MAVADVKLVEIIKVITTGIVCVVAIQQCGIFAVLLIAFAAIFKKAIEVSI